VAEYWIILPNERTAEVHRRPVAGRYCEIRVVHEDEELACGSVPGLRIALTELFAGWTDMPSRANLPAILSFMHSPSH